MINRTIKMRITKILKTNGFSKSEFKKEWNHPKRKIAGFEYFEFNNGLTYYISDGLFSEEERLKLLSNKINSMYNILVDNGLGQYLTKYDYTITWNVKEE